MSRRNANLSGKTHTTEIMKKGRDFWRLSGSLTIVVAIVALFSITVMLPRDSRATLASTCDSRGILFQYPSGTDTQVHLIDMVTGADSYTTAGDPDFGRTIAGMHINAIGYNVLDDNVYGWDDTANTLVRINPDLETASVEPMTISPAIPAPTAVIIGDVDENGHYWFINGNGQNGNEYYQVDVTTGTTTANLVSQGTVSGVPAGNSAGADWVYVPGGAGLYRVTHDTGVNQGRVLVFDRSTGQFSSVGLIPTSELPSSDLKEGAFYADPEGFMYASDNDDGNIYRINIANSNHPVLDTNLFANGPPSGANDGARCANALIPIDFGDAPSVYGTLLGDDGPRHGVIGYDAGAHTAPLMLGRQVDVETDGFPSTNSDGDNLNNINDERSVQHIVATPGTPTALSVPVTVTNHSSDAATLVGWIDLDGSNTFDVTERVTANVPAGSGQAVYELNFPETTFTANSSARFRVFSVSDTSDAAVNMLPTGSAAGGEAEDYEVQVGTYEVLKSSSPASGSTVSPGDTITYTLNITNTGLTDLINLTLHDNLADVLDDAAFEGSPIVSPSSAGTATVDNDNLEFVFTGDVLTGQSVAVTYAVKVGSTLGNATLHNLVIAAHSNCHPDVNAGVLAVSDPACQTTHPVDATLADTGDNLGLMFTTAIALLGGSGLILYGIRRRVAQTVSR